MTTMPLIISFFSLCAAGIVYLFWLNIDAHNQLDKNIKALHEQNERLLKLLNRK